MKFTYPGLTNQEVEASRAQHGSNAVASQDIETFWDKLLNNLQPGDTVPTDGLLLAGHAEMDEAMLTGESESVKKTALAKSAAPAAAVKQNQLFRAGLMVDGEGVMRASGGRPNPLRPNHEGAAVRRGSALPPATQADGAG